MVQRVGSAAGTTVTAHMRARTNTHTHTAHRTSHTAHRTPHTAHRTHPTPRAHAHRSQRRLIECRHSAAGHADSVKTMPFLFTRDSDGAGVCVPLCLRRRCASHRRLLADGRPDSSHARLAVRTGGTTIISKTIIHKINMSKRGFHKIMRRRV